MASPAVLHRALKFIEHPLFLTVVGIVGGVGVAFSIFWGLLVVFVMLALYRSRAVSDLSGKSQIAIYTALVIVSSGAWWIVKRNSHSPTATEIAVTNSSSLQGGRAVIASPGSSPQRSVPVPIETPPYLLLSLFMTDHSHIQGALTSPWKDVIKRYGREIGEIYFRVSYEIPSHAKFISILASNDPRIAEALSIVAYRIPEYLKVDSSNLQSLLLRGQGETQAESLASYAFSGRVYIYHSFNIPIERLGDLTRQYKNLGMAVEFRGSDYADGVWANVRAGIANLPPEYTIQNGLICLVGHEGCVSWSKEALGLR
jgi:hypothetical protein